MKAARFSTATGDLTVIQVYVPTSDADDSTIIAFYTDLQKAISTAKNSNMLLVIGDLNAKIGKHWSYASGVIGKHRYGESND